MKLIAGLGNPGPRYADSRHNIGFLVIDALAQRWKLDVGRHEKRFEALMGDGPLAAERCLLLKPMTYMNLSGRSVAAAKRFYKLDDADVLVVYDDLDLPVGKLRLRAGGSAGGHNGMGDVIRQLGTDQLARVRVGIGRTSRGDTVDYVLGKFAPDERAAIEFAVVDAADAVEAWVRRGVEAAMNEFNRSDARRVSPEDRTGDDECRQ